MKTYCARTHNSFYGQITRHVCTNGRYCKGDCKPITDKQTKLTWCVDKDGNYVWLNITK